MRPMVMMGNRSGPSEAIQQINHELRKNIKTLPPEGMEKIHHGGNVRISGQSTRDLKVLPARRRQEIVKLIH